MRDAVLLNAGAALAVHDEPGADPVTALVAGMERAAPQAVDSASSPLTGRRCQANWVEVSSRPDPGAERADRGPGSRSAERLGRRSGGVEVEHVHVALAAEAQVVVVGADHAAAR